MSNEHKNKDYTLSISILMSAVILAGAWIYTAGLKSGQGGQAQVKSQTKAEVVTSALEEKILPSAGVALPVKWDDIAKRMGQNGGIDFQKLEAIYATRGGMEADTKTLLQKSDNGSITMTSQNSGEILNLLWAFGMANKNPILENGPMMTYSGAGLPADLAFVAEATSAKEAALAKARNFASTGGWTIAVGDPMSHYSVHQLVTLTADQQALVESISKNIYRPCCGNSVYFPDCNHGMAMLGLLQLLAAEGLSEEEMYDYALAVNSYWFPDTYTTIAKYFQKRGTPWEEVLPKTALGELYSSNAGYQRVLADVMPPQNSTGGGNSC